MDGYIFPMESHSDLSQTKNLWYLTGMLLERSLLAVPPDAIKLKPRS